MNSSYLIDFEIKGDSRGSLISFESNANIPFEVKRVYYIFGTQDGVKRGFHAHKNLTQLLICSSGSCKVSTYDGKEKNIYSLSRPDSGLLISKIVWREMYDFSKDCVLMVLASDFYNEADYIRNYDEFMELVQK